MLCARHRSLVKPLEPSRRAADLLGPNVLRPAASRSSTMPATSGPSGPTTTKSTLLALQKAITAAWSVMSSGTHSASRAMPALHAKPSACRSTRSEEHTSELQSRQYLVCRLLLEKKKTQHQHRRPGR